jgi:hypothetical protein
LLVIFKNITEYKFDGKNYIECWLIADKKWYLGGNWYD